MVKASALVVGIERYGFSQQGQNKGKEAHLAAEFALWLRDNKVCPADRITLMVAYSELDYNELESPAAILAELQRTCDGDRGVTIVKNARIENFSDWARDRHPAHDDERFVFFWAGRGLADQSDPFENVFLLTEDANDRRLRHLELRQLLHSAGTHAPSARRVAFVDGCYGMPGRKGGPNLSDRWSVPPGTGTPNAEDKFIVYAAAHGETTGDYRSDDHGFTHTLLDCLDRFPGPKAIFEEPTEPPGPGQEEKETFEERLAREVFELWRDQPGTSSWTIYRYLDPYRRPEPTDVCFPVPDDSQLKASEWASLLAEVEGIAISAKYVLWNAYCYAAGPPPADGSRPMPRRLDNLGDLIRELRDLPPDPDLPPPLVVACDFVANLPIQEQYAGLNKWCRDWAATRSSDGSKRLQRAILKRPTKLHDRPYLSILVEPIVTTQDYRIGAVLWSGDNPKWVPRSEHANVPYVDINNIVGKLFHQMGLAEAKDDSSGVIVEFVLPRRLLGWPGYKENSNIGLPYPVVVRDLDRLLGHGSPASKDMAEAKWQEIQKFRPSWRVSWVNKIKWFECDSDPDQVEIQNAVYEKDVYCIALALPAGLVGDAGRGMPPFLSEAVDAGAPLVIWILQEDLSRKHEHGRKWVGTLINDYAVPKTRKPEKCVVPNMRKRIERDIRHSGKGFLELPYLIHKLRRELSGKANRGSRPQIGLLIEDPGRFWPGYFNWQSPSWTVGPASEGR